MFCSRLSEKLHFTFYFPKEYETSRNKNVLQKYVLKSATESVQVRVTKKTEIKLFYIKIVWTNLIDYANKLFWGMFCS